MDLYCPNCGEPYEFDHVQHEMTRTERADFNMGKCAACAGDPSLASDKGAMAAAMYSILGEDMDGAAAMFEDFA